MYKEHKAFTPPDGNDEIWRYMDFTKFVSLIDTSSLYFCRSDLLGDPFEGSITEVNAAFRKEMIHNLDSDTSLGLDDSNNKTTFLAEEIRKMIYISSWSIGQHESAALWNIYLKSGDGIAIKSTFNNLVKSLENDKENEIRIGKVQYIDYKIDMIKPWNVFYPYLCKRKSFEHEHELRAIYLDASAEAISNPDFLGVYIPIDLNILIEKIFVSPKAPDWFNYLIESVCEKYKLEKEIIPSSLNDRPIF